MMKSARVKEKEEAESGTDNCNIEVLDTESDRIGIGIDMGRQKWRDEDGGKWEAYT